MAGGELPESRQVAGRSWPETAGLRPGLPLKRTHTIPPTPPRLAQESYGLAHSATYLLTLKSCTGRPRFFVFSFPVVLPPTACTFRPRNAFKNSAGRSRFVGGRFRGSSDDRARN